MPTTAPRTDPEAVDYEERAPTALMDATRRVGGAYAEIAAGLADVLRDLGRLKMRGLTRNEMTHVELCVAGVLADLYPGCDDLDHVRRARSQAPGTRYGPTEV